METSLLDLSLDVLGRTDERPAGHRGKRDQHQRSGGGLWPRTAWRETRGRDRPGVEAVRRQTNQRHVHRQQPPPQPVSFVRIHHVEDEGADDRQAQKHHDLRPGRLKMRATQTTFSGAIRTPGGPPTAADCNL